MRSQSPEPSRCFGFPSPRSRRRLPPGGRTSSCSFPFIFAADGRIITQRSAVIDASGPSVVFNRQELLSLPSLPVGFQVISAFCSVSCTCLLTINATFALSDHLILHNAGTSLADWKMYH